MARLDFAEKRKSAGRPSIVPRRLAQPFLNQKRVSSGCLKCQCILGFETRRNISMRMAFASVIVDDTSSPPTERTKRDDVPVCAIQSSLSNRTSGLSWIGVDRRAILVLHRV